MKTVADVTPLWNFKRLPFFIGPSKFHPIIPTNHIWYVVHTVKRFCISMINFNVKPQNMWVLRTWHLASRSPDCRFGDEISVNYKFWQLFEEIFYSCIPESNLVHVFKHFYVKYGTNYLVSKPLDIKWVKISDFYAKVPISAPSITQLDSFFRRNKKKCKRIGGFLSKADFLQLCHVRNTLVADVTHFLQLRTEKLKIAGSKLSWFW